MFEIVLFFEIFFFNCCAALEALLQHSAYRPTDVASRLGLDPCSQGHLRDADDIQCNALHLPLTVAAILGLQGIQGFFCFVFVFWIQDSDEWFPRKDPPLARRVGCSSPPSESCPMMLACPPPLLCQLWPFLSKTNTTRNCMCDISSSVLV